MKLTELLTEKLDKLMSAKFEDAFEYTYYEKICDEITSSKEMLISDGSIILTLLSLNNKIDNFNDTYEFISKHANFNKKHTSRDTLDIIKFLGSLSYLEEIGLIDELLESDEKIDAKNIISQKGISDIKEKELIISSITIYIKSGILYFNNIDNLKKFLKMIKGDCEKIFISFSKVSSYREAYDVIQVYKDKKVRTILKENNMNSSIAKKVLNISEVDAFINGSLERLKVLRKRFKKFAKQNAEMQEIYKKTILLLEKIDGSNSITIPNEIIDKLDDESLIELIKVVLDNERKIHTDMQIENIKKNRYDEIRNIFYQNRINIDLFSEESQLALFNNINIETLKKMMSYLNLEEFKWLKNHPSLICVLLNSEEDIFKNIIFWLKNGILHNDMVYKNIGVFIKNIDYKVDKNDCIPCFNKVKNNIYSLSKLANINNKLLKNNDILFVENSFLRQTIELAKKYKLNFESENSNNYGLEILNNPLIFDDLDRFIELGFSNYIVDNIQCLNKNSTEIVQRLSIIVNSGLNPYANEDKISSSILTGKNFFVSNEELGEYRLIDVEEYTSSENFEILKQNSRISVSKSTLELEIVRYFDNLYKISELEYSFDNIIISRMKFLRNLECLIKNNATGDFVFCALTYKSNLDDEILEFINKAIMEFNGIQKSK